MAQTEHPGEGMSPGWCEDERVGVLHLLGREALDLIQRLGANDVGSLAVGQTAATPLLTEKGRIVDILTLRHNGDHLLVLCSALRADEVKRWIENFIITEDIEVRNVTSSYTVTWICGADFESRARELKSDDHESLVTIPHYASDLVKWRVEHVDSCLRDESMRITAAERDLRSLVLGIPTAPGELNQRFTPYDVNLRNLISYTKGCYIGQEVIARLDAYGKTHRRMVGLLGRAQLGKTPPLEVRKSGEIVGTLTSVAPCSAPQGWPALAVVESKAVNDGDVLEVEPGISLTSYLLPMSL